MKRKNLTFVKFQQGVVLFVALIALVVMSLAAVALIRSVDTNTLITGNLSFKQSSVIAADQGIEEALTRLNAQAIANADVLNTSSAANGYFATFLAPTSPNLDDIAVLKDNATWAANNSLAVASVGSESIRVIVQRMCRNELAPAKETCLFGEDEVGTGSKGVKDATEAGAKVSGAQSPMYRVTVRSVGAKNTVSYTQAYVY
ncbi:MAG: pilus assembly PilX family protein [Methylophilaceae bacterium]